MFSKIILVSLLITFVKGQTIQTGPCPQVEVVQNFDVARYLGLWYQISRYPNPFERGNCSTALYGPVTEDGLVLVHNAEIVNGEESSIDGTAELTNPNSTEAKLTVKFFNPDSVADYWVLGTDYDNYSLVWSCASFAGNLFHVQFSWVLGREKPLPSNITDIVNNLIAANKINPDFFQVHEEESCIKSPSWL